MFSVTTVSFRSRTAASSTSSRSGHASLIDSPPHTLTSSPPSFVGASPRADRERVSSRSSRERAPCLTRAMRSDRADAMECLGGRRPQSDPLRARRVRGDPAFRCRDRDSPDCAWGVRRATRACRERSVDPALVRSCRGTRVGTRQVAVRCAWREACPEDVRDRKPYNGRRLSLERHEDSSLISSAKLVDAARSRRHSRMARGCAVDQLPARCFMCVQRSG